MCNDRRVSRVIGLSVCNTCCMSTEVSAGTVPEWTRGDRMRKALEYAGVSTQEMADYLEASSEVERVAA